MRTRQAIPSPPAEKALDVRASVRYMLHARVVFHWNDEEGFQKVGRGHTRDISQKGVYVVSPERPPNGVDVSLNIYLPALAGDTRLLSLETHGQVLRVDSDSTHEPADPAGFGFAVSSHKITLCTN
jgi:hypothetical protein